MAGIGQFALGEGVDGSGVPTKFLTCNCSINLIIENKSKLFGLHVRPPVMEISFGRLSFASSHVSRPNFVLYTISDLGWFFVQNISYLSLKSDLESDWF